MKHSAKIFISAVLLCAGASTVFADNLKITVIHTNDIHGWAMGKADRKEKERLVGGAAALSNFLKSHREKNTPMLLLDGGDWFVGTPEGTLPGGKMMAEVFNALKYDATVVGNHEFDFGEDALKALTDQMETDVLGANVYQKGSHRHAEFVKPYILKEIQGVTIGIFGVNTSDMKGLSFEKNIAGLDFRSEVETARLVVAELKKKGADVIICLSHAGYEGATRHADVKGDQSIAKAVSGIDLIVGGHTHTPIWEPKHFNGTLIVQAWSYLTHVGEVTLEIDRKTKKVVASQGRLVKLWQDQWGQDPEILKIVQTYEESVGRRLSETIGEAESDLKRDYKKDDVIGNWMTDCMRRWTKTDVAIQNGGGIRASLLKGPIQLRNIFEVMPFPNYVVTLNMPGKSLLEVFDRGVGGEVGMIEISGAQLRYKEGAPAGKRITSAKIDGQEVDPKAIYSVSAPDFIVEGGGGYDFSAGRDKATHPMLIRDVLTWCVRNYSPVRRTPVDRIVED